MIASDRLGRRVESAMIGNEGAGGLMETCGSGTATLHCVVQVDGQAWRAPSSLCRELALSGEGFARRAWTAAELQMFEARQSAFCQARHTVEARFARWLLESLERSGGRNPMPLTQEFVAAMLGVQRTTVSGFASQLQREGLITYHRGSLTLVDEAALERRACECRAGHDQGADAPGLPGLRIVTVQAAGRLSRLRRAAGRRRPVCSTWPRPRAGRRAAGRRR